MSKISKTLSIQARHDRVWEALADYQNIHRFHPSVETVDQLSSEDRGVGAVRRCNFYDGTSIVEQITDWQEGRSLTVELSEFNFPFKAAKARISARPDGDDRTEVTFEMEIAPKYGPLGWLMTNVMMRPMMKGMFGKILAGLELHARTGELVGKDGAPADRRLPSSA